MSYTNKGKLDEIIEIVNTINSTVTSTVISYAATASTISGGISNVTSTEVLVAPSNQNRLECILQNVNTDAVLVKLGTGVGTSSYNFILTPDTGIRAGNGGTLTIDNYLGDITIICESGKTSSVGTTEFLREV